MIWSGAGPVSNVTIKDNQIRDSKRANLAVVVSGKTSGITLEGNQIDGEIAKRNGGSFNGNNTTNDSRMASSAPVPAGMPQLRARAGITESGWWPWFDGVVPFRMKGVAV
jgi:hypothetical protein